MLLYFSLTLFVSAALLFLVQPMIGKMILPQLGGTPAVWNTCMVFFQGVLLVGYGYTHLLTTTQPTRRQVLIQGCLLFLPFLVLPFSLGAWVPETDGNPVFSLLGKLIIMVALPFFMVSTTAPLLQKWFFHTGHPTATDPYFLYGASNFGSMLGLALYPTVIEPWLQVAPPEGESTWQTQVHLWTVCYAVFVALVIGCAVIVWQALAGKYAAALEPVPVPLPIPEPATAIAATTPKRRGARIETAAATTTPVNIPKPDAQDDITLLRRLRWIGLAAAPSSLMLGVTTYITTDIAAVSSFWIIPLMMYLATFILAFARWPIVWTGTPHTVVMFVQPMLMLFLVLRMCVPEPTPPTWLEFVLNLSAFFSTALMCHGELAKDRPSAKHLTEFFFWMSLGGVLGGLFNALFAPIVFQHGLWEYPITMAFACLMRSNLVDQPKTLIPHDSTAERPTILGHVMDLGFPVVMGLLCYFFLYKCVPSDDLPFLLQRKFLIAGLVVGVLAMSLRPVRFGLSIAALFIAITVYERRNDPLIYEGRGFFGYLRVRQSPQGGWRSMPATREGEPTPAEWKMYRTLIHGGIDHGCQIVRYKYADEAGNEYPETEEMNRLKRREPMTYFHQRNGVAELFYKLAWPKAEPLTAIRNMTGQSDARLAASMFGLAFGASPPLALLADTQSEPPYAVIGLGTGILACYAKPYQHVDFFEIDPLVKNLSMVPDYVPPWKDERAQKPSRPDPTFYYVYDAQERWANIHVTLGDGRLKIKEAPQNYYHVIVLDAFSSDAIPVHLLTKEAIKLYLDKLADGGVLLFNTTNCYVRIEGVLAAIARDLDLDCLYCPDNTYGSDHPDRLGADWVVLQRKLTTIVETKNGTTLSGFAKEDSANHLILQVGGDEIKVLKADIQARTAVYKNGGRPIRERLERKRTRLAWNGAVIRDDEHKDIVDDRWQDIAPLPGPAWTDGYSNMMNPRVMPWLTGWYKK